MKVYTLITQDREEPVSVGVAVYTTLEAAVEAIVQGMVEDNEGRTSEAEARSTVKVGDTTAAAYDPLCEIDYQVYQVEVQS